MAKPLHRIDHVDTRRPFGQRGIKAMVSSELRASRAAKVAGQFRIGQYVLALCLLLCGTHGIALTQHGTLRDLRHTAWGPKEGAPGAIAAMAQTSDGYLWLGTAAGLLRFDGLRFERVDLPRDERLSSANIFALFAPESGGLWIGFSFGGAAFLKDGKMTAYGPEEGLPLGSVQTFAHDSDGTLWAGTGSGLARLDGARWTKVGAADGYSDIETRALMIDGEGTFWAASKNKVLYRPKGEALFREADVPVQGKSESFIGLATSPGQGVWLLREDRLRLLRHNPNSSGPRSASGTSMLFDKDGSLWLSTGTQVFRLTHPLEVATQVVELERLTLDSFSEREGLTVGVGSGALLEDREGNVWAATGSGLNRFSERNVALARASNQSANLASSMGALAAAEQGDLWIGDRLGSAISLRGDRVSRHEELFKVSCALRLDDGSVWFGGGDGLWRYSAGRIERHALPRGTDGFEVQAMAQDRSGRLWISIIRSGVFRLEKGEWTAYGGIELLPKLTAITLATDYAGRIWFGYTEGRVAVLDGDRVTFFSDTERVSVGNVTAIQGKRRAVWIGGEFGLAVFDGSRFRPLTPEVGTTFNNTTGILETPNGDLWMNTSGGIVHVTAEAATRATADASYRIRGETFDSRDGVQGSSARLRPLPTAVEGTDGRLWFSRNVGVYSIDPRRIHRNTTPPPVLITALTVNDRTYMPEAGLELPQNTTSLRIDYVGLSLTMAEKVRYRYKLDGVDDGWQEVEARREAFYTNLKPGRHRFQVIAANNDGVWNETGAALEFSILPTFVQTGWFIALCTLAAIGAIALAVRLRTLQLSSRIRIRFEERMAERERIARELHDTLLQGTQGLFLSVQAAANRMTEGDPTRILLNETLDRADRLMSEGRDRIQDLRIPADTAANLPESLAAVGEELAQTHAVKFSVNVEGFSCALSPDVRQEAYCIGREALLNAFRHSKANAIELQVIYDPSMLRVRVRDDGVGVDAGALESRVGNGRWGLRGMQERSKRIHSSLDMWSRPQAGTEVELQVPAATAYLSNPARPSWPSAGSS